MDANPYDQFDPAPTTPAPAAPPTTAAAPAAPVKNPYDQFDAPAPQADATKPPPENLGAEFAKGLATGLPSMLSTVMPGSESAFNTALTLLHANPNDYFPTPTTLPGRLARAGGEGAIGMLLPGGEERGFARIIQMGKDMLAGTIGGVTAQGATEVAPEPLKPAAGLVGGLVGGTLGLGAMEVPGMVKQAATRASDYLAPAIPGNTEKLAASKLGDIVTDRPAAIEALNPPTEIVPGSKPTSFQASGDTGLGTLERVMARSDPNFKASLLGRLDEQNAARVSALENVTDPANPAAVADYFKLRMQDLESRGDALYSDAQKQAQDAYQGLGDQSAADTGAAARQALEARRKALNTEANHLWDSIDPNKDLNVTTGPLVRSTAKIYGTMGPEEMLSMTPGEKALAGIIGTYGSIIPFQRFKQLRTAINAAMSDAKRAGQNQAYGRLTQLRSSVEDAVHDSIAGKVAEQQQGVAAGQVSEDDTLAANFLRQAKEWYAQREGQTGAGVAAGNGVPEAGGPAAVPRPAGTASPPSGGPAGAPGVEGLPQNDHIQPSTGALSGQGNQPAGGEPRLRTVPGTAADQRGDQGGYLAGREPDGSLVGLPRRIRSTMKERFLAAGVAPDVAEANAAIYEATHNQMAARSGMTPEEFAKTYPLPEVRKSTEAPEGSLKQSPVDTGALADFINTPDSWLDKEPLMKALKPILKEYKNREEGSLSKFDTKLNAHIDLWEKALGAIQKYGKDSGGLVAPQVIEAVRKFMGTPGTEKAPTVKADPLAEIEAAKNPKVWDGVSGPAGSFVPTKPKAISPTTIDHIPGETKPGPKTYQSIPAGVADIAYAKENPALLETPAFKEFFKDSAVTDRKGNPLVVYHGTKGGAFRHFRDGHSFFAADPKTARTYANGADSLIKLADPERMLDDPRVAQAAFNDPSFNVKRHPPIANKKGEDWYTISHREPFSESRVVEHFSNRQQALEYLDDYADKINQAKGGGSGLHPVYLSIQNPHEVDWEGRGWNDGPNGEDTQPRYEAWVDGDHCDTYDSYDEAQQAVDKYLDEIRKSAESEARDELQHQFEIKAPTPLFGDHDYQVTFFDENGDPEHEVLARDLSEVQDYIENTINEKAKDAGHEAVDNATSNGHYGVEETEGETGYGRTTDQVVSWARNQSEYDGVIFRNIKDPSSGQDVPATDVFVPFSPRQIKSTANLGTFSGNSHRLLFQSGEGGPRGAIEFGPDNAALIHMLGSADKSSGIHELGHHFLRNLQSMANHEQAPAQLRQDWNTVRDWWGQNSFGIAREAGKGVQPGDVRAALEFGTTGDAAKDEAVNRAMHEHWARGFESYLRDGVAPTKGLAAVFHQFKQWLGQIYKSATALNVHVSPEMKGVFDRMLGAPDGAGAKPPKLIDKAAADRFARASAATRNMKETFGAKPVASILKRPGGNTMPYGMTDEGVSSALWRPGAEGAAHIKAVLNAAPEARPSIEQAAVQSLKRAASKDGTIDPQKLAAWRAKHTDALSQVPSLDRRLSDAAKATETMVQIGAKRAAVATAVQKTAIGKLLKVSSDADVTSTVGAMLGKADAVRSMRELVAEAKNDPDAMAGLQRAVVDHMIGRLKSPKDALRSDSFQRFLGKNAPALSEVLRPEQMNSLRAIAQDLKRASRDVRAPGGGSDTAENLANRQAMVHQPTLLGKIFRLIMDSGVGTAIGLLTHPLAGLASAIGSFAVQSAREKGLKRVDDLIKEAILDPDLMRTLLMKAPAKRDTGSHRTLGHQLTKLAIFTANRAKG